MSPTFAGHTYLCKPDVGGEVRLVYSRNGKEAAWRWVEAFKGGPPVGQTETATIASFRIADGVYSISWVEIDGFVVSKVVDLNAGTDYSFWSFEVPGKHASTAPSRRGRASGNSTSAPSGWSPDRSWPHLLSAGSSKHARVRREVGESPLKSIDQGIATGLVVTSTASGYTLSFKKRNCAASYSGPGGGEPSNTC